MEVGVWWFPRGKLGHSEQNVSKCVPRRQKLQMFYFVPKLGFESALFFQYESPSQERMSSSVQVNKHLPSTYSTSRSVGGPTKGKKTQTQTHSLVTKTVLVWMRCHKNAETRVCNIDWWVAGCWKDPIRGSSRLWVLKFEEDFLGGTRSRGNFRAEGLVYAKVYRCVIWLNMDDTWQVNTC